MDLSREFVKIRKRKREVNHLTSTRLRPPCTHTNSSANSTHCCGAGGSGGGGIDDGAEIGMGVTDGAM